MELPAKHNRYIDPDDPPPPRGSLAVWRVSLGRVIAFAATFSILQFGWQALRGSAVEYAVIHRATVQPAAFLINRFTPDVHAHAVEFSIHAPGGGLNVLNGCEGLESLFLLGAAFVVAPLSVRSRLVGFALGSFVVFAVNQARILVLFYAYRYNHELFYSLHATVMPIAVVFCLAAFFYFWLVRYKRDAHAA
jgi:exosortase/archaeosortase family protein